MRSTHLFSVIICLLIGSQLQAQSFSEKYSALKNKKDSEAQEKLLREWESADNNDPELYVAYFNFLLNQSRDEVLRIDGSTEAPNSPALVLKEPEKDETVGHIYSDITYEPNLLKQALSYLDRGINKFPNRLDMRFGKTYMLAETKDYEAMTAEVLKVIEYSNQINNQWLWKANQQHQDAKKMMLDAIQDYQVKLFDAQSIGLLNNIRKIADAVLKYYPDHIESLSNFSVTYLIEEKYDEALKYMLQAEKVNPQDKIILGNIAYTYRLLGKSEQAIRYYNKLAKYEDESGKRQIKKLIEELEKKD